MIACNSIQCVAKSPLFRFIISVTAVVVMTLTTIGCGSDVTDPSENNSSLHNQGQGCLNCHGINTLTLYPFTSGGTVFTKLDAADDNISAYATGYLIRLVMQTSGEVVTYLPRLGCANSHTLTSIDTSFTAQVVDANGTVVNSSGINTHGIGKVNCNSCHTAVGKSGAPGRIVNYQYVP